MNDNEKIKKLLGKLYIKTYTHEVVISCMIDSKDFLYYLKKDWRFQNIYNNYRTSKNVNISFDDFIKQELWHLQKFVFDCLLDIPKKEQPKHIYVDEVYPFRFEVYNNIFTMPEFDDFERYIWSRFMRRIGYDKIMDLNEDEKNSGMIEELKYRIKLKDIEIAQRKGKPNKRIYKYDKNGQLDKIYENRKICCDAEGITKAALSMHLSGQRKRLKGYTYKEIVS